MNIFLTFISLVLDACNFSRSTGLGKWQLFKTLLGLYIKSKFHRRTEDVVHHTIHAFTIYSYDFPTLIQLYREIFLERIYHVNASTDRPFIIDAGANIGMAVLYFKECYPHSEIWAFEPNPNSFALLEKNIRANNIKNVRLFHQAVSDTNEVMDFYVPANKNSLNGSSDKDYSSGEKITVMSQKLSDILKGKKVNFIKMDIEGDEEKVIRDLTAEHILQHVDALVIEYHHKMQHATGSFSKFLLLLEQNGFEYGFRLFEDAILNSQNVVICFNRNGEKN